MKNKKILISLALVLVALSSFGYANTNNFTEDFVTSTFKDTVNTTTDWNTVTGVLQLSQIPGTTEQINCDIVKQATTYYYYFVWLDFREGGSYGNIYAQKYDSSGVKQWTNDVRVNVTDVWYSAGYPSVPHIAVDGNDNIYITWNAGTTKKVWLQKLNTSGVRQWSTDKQVNTTITPEWYGSDLVCDSNGFIYVVFEREQSQGLYIQKLDANGVTQWASDKVAVNGLSAEQYDPSIAHYNSSGTDYFYVVYRGGSGYGYHLNRLDAAGLPLWPADVTVSSQKDDGPNNVCVAADPAGMAIVAYVKNGDIFLQQYNPPSGTEYWPGAPLQITNDAYVQKNVEISYSDYSDSIYLSWLDRRSDTNYDIYAQKIRYNNVQWGVGGKLVNTTDALDQNGSNVAEYGSGCFVAWSDSRNSESSIYANSLNTYGTRQFTNDLRINTDTAGYVSSAQGQSLNIDTVSENITSATLTATQTLNGQTISYYLSNDNGSNWSAVTSGNLYTFGTTGSALRWRAVLSTTNSSVTPTVNTIQLSYNYTPTSFSLTQVYPLSAINSGSKTVTIWGANFSGSPTVKLSKTGQSDIVAGTVNVVSGNKITATFNLTGAPSGVWDVVVENGGVATLKKVFSINALLSQSTWYPEEIDIGVALNKIVVADGDNDGVLEIYGNRRYLSGVYQLKYSGSTWEQTLVDNSYSNGAIAVGDGNEDGANELYIASSDEHIYQLKWSGSSWVKTDVGIAANSAVLVSVAVGDGNNDGKLEVYSPAAGSIYQFKWNGAGWDRTEIAAASVSFKNVEVVDGNNDGLLEVYVSGNNVLYQLKFAGSWNKTTVGQTQDTIEETRISDADNDGTLEVYCVSADDHIYQFLWNGASWVKTDMGANGNNFSGVGSGDGNNDGVVEVYTANGDNSISQFKWSGSSWLKTAIFNSTYSFSDVVVADADEDGKIDIYAFGSTKLVKVTTQSDSGAPEVVGDLAASPSPAPGEVNLSWTSRGDDGNIGNNSNGSYIVRYANSPIVTESDFTAATNYPNAWLPSFKGASENHYVGGLSSNTTYYFAIKTSDEIPYTSSIDTGTPRAVARVKGTPFYTRTVFDDSWYFSPSGFMGENNGASMMLTTVSDNPAQGTKCLKLVYDAESESWVGFFALNNGWGGQGINLSNYSNMVFKIRATGTNVPCTEVRYGVGESSDSCGEIRSDWLKISDYWQTYSLDLSGYNLNDVNGIFMITVRGPLAGTPVIYLDDIKFVGWGGFALTDLTAVSGTGDGEINITWTTPAGSEYPLSHYIVKYSTNPITNQTEFAGATTFAQSWTPKAEGEADSQLLSGLAPGTLYYIAIEVVDTAGTQSPLSNTVGNSAVAGTSASISVTSILPSSGTNNGNRQIRIYGGGFASGVTAKLVRAGYADIVGSNITVISGSEIRAFFDLNGKQIGLWDVYVERNSDSSVLAKSFMVSSPISSPKYWLTEYIGSFDDGTVRDLALGDVDGDSSLELYGANDDHHIYQYKWVGGVWQKTDIGSGEAAMYAVAVGDGNNNGEIEVYAGGMDAHVYQFRWNGSSWDKQDLGNTGTFMDGIAVGDADYDGQREVYGGGNDGHIYRFYWTGANWEKTDIGSSTSFMWSVSIGDGNNDGQPEVYGGTKSGYIYQFKWNGTSWDKTQVGSTVNGSVGGGGGGIEVIATLGDFNIYKMSVGDGDNDGTVEIFAACGDGSVYQFKWNGSAWDKTALISVENPMYGVSIGDGNNDGQQEVYGAGSDGRIYQCAWSGVGWEKEKIDSGAGNMYAVVVGDGNNNGKLEVYGANASGFIYQFTKVEIPVTELLKEEHVYDDQWRYPPSGFMGEKDGISLVLQANSTENPFEGTRCNQITYDATQEDWAGVFVQASGAWNGKGINLTGYTKLTFRARIDAENADAIQVQYGLGESGDGASYRSSWYTLTPEWQEFVIDLTGMNLTDINGLFMFNLRRIRSVDPEIFLDDIKFVGPGPAAITDLTATRGAHGGEINLTWTVPAGGVVNYIVKYSTSPITNQIDFDKALTYDQQWIPGATGATESKILTGLDSGGYYYLAIESIDTEGRQSALSNIAAAMARLTGIGIMVEPGIISLGTVRSGQVVVSTSSIGVTNVGGVPLTVQLGLAEPPGWKSSTVSNGINIFVLNAAFATSPTNISWSVANHALSPEVVTCTSTKFAGNSTGVNIQLDEMRSLWVQFMSPTQIGMGTESQEIGISIMGTAP